MGVFRGGGGATQCPPPPPPKMPFYHDEGSTGDTSLAALPSVLNTKLRKPDDSTTVTLQATCYLFFQYVVTSYCSLNTNGLAFKALYTPDEISPVPRV